MRLILATAISTKVWKLLNNNFKIDFAIKCMLSCARFIYLVCGCRLYDYCRNVSLRSAGWNDSWPRRYHREPGLEIVLLHGSRWRHSAMRLPVAHSSSRWRDERYAAVHLFPRPAVFHHVQLEAYGVRRQLRWSTRWKKPGRLKFWYCFGCVVV